MRTLLTKAYENSQLYNHHSLPRTNSRGGGLAVIYKRQIELTLLSHINTSDFEAAIFCFPKKVMTLCLLYRSLSVSTKMFLEFYAKTFNPYRLRLTCFQLVILMRQSAALKSFFQESSLTQLVKKPTHRAGSILDLLVTNDPYLFSEIEQQHLNYSDHDLINFWIFHEIVSSNSAMQIDFSARKKADINKRANDLELTLV